MICAVVQDGVVVNVIVAEVDDVPPEGCELVALGQADDRPPCDIGQDIAEVDVPVLDEPTEPEPASDPEPSTELTDGD